MLRHLGGDRVGLVTFAGSAFVRSPLTLDLDAVAELVARAQQEGALVRPGTDIGGAIRAAAQLLDAPDRARTQVMVLISDGEDLGAGVAEAAAQAQARGVRIYARRRWARRRARWCPRSRARATWWTSPAAPTARRSRASRATARAGCAT